MFVRGSNGVDVGVHRDMAAISRETKNPVCRSLRFEVLYAAPNAPRDGDVYFADGVSWNPGAGRGLYEYNGGWGKL